MDERVLIGFHNVDNDSGTHYFYEYSLNTNTFRHLVNFTNEGSFAVTQVIKAKDYFYYRSTDGTTDRIHRVSLNGFSRTTIQNELRTVKTLADMCLKTENDLFFSIWAGSSTLGVYLYDNETNSYSLYFTCGTSNVPNASIGYNALTNRLGVSHTSYGGAVTQQVYDGTSTYTTSLKSREVVVFPDGAVRFQSYNTNASYLLPHDSTTFVLLNNTSDANLKNAVFSTDGTNKLIYGSKWITGNTTNLLLFTNGKTATSTTLSTTNHCNLSMAGNSDLSIIIYSIASNNSFAKITNPFGTPSQTTVAYPDSLTGTYTSTRISPSYKVSNSLFLGGGL